jgi:hypothetical protein
MITNSTSTDIIVTASTTYTDKQFYADLNKSHNKLKQMAEEALREHELGLTMPFPCSRFMGWVWHCWIEVKRYYLTKKGVIK